MVVSCDFDAKLVKWLVENLKRLIADTPRLGFLASKKGSNAYLILNVKRNRGGTFLSTLWFGVNIKRDSKSIYSPGPSTRGMEGLIFIFTRLYGFNK